jgi:glycosyltransferase involved in cell wall biosynthesis
VWTSRTIGPKRGLESFIKVAAKVHLPFELHLIGDCSADYRSFLEKEFPYSIGHKLVFHDFMSHEELQQFLPKFDAGLAIELSQPESRNVTITNKILQYIQSSLQVLATDTIGQIELSNQFSSVVLISNSDLGSWSKRIEEIIKSKREFNNGLQKLIYDEYFSWAKQEEKLENLIRKTYDK